MQYEKKLKIVRSGCEESVTYYVRKKLCSEFGCEMYNVGIAAGYDKKEIEDFSPSAEEAIALCNRLYEQTVSPKNLFSFAEEFITLSDI